MSDFTIELVFTDGSKVIHASGAETILEAARRQGIKLIAECTLGLCGTCKASRESGESETDALGSEGLTPMERRRGYILTCQSFARSDLRLRFAYEFARCVPRTEVVWQGTVAAKEMVSDAVARLQIELAAGHRLDFRPGQYVSIRVPGTAEQRAFSFANPPGESILEFFVRILPDGVMSNYVRLRARIGQSLEMTGPHGEFYLRKVSRPVLMVAGGTGLAPMLSMLEHLSSSDGCAQPVRLLYGSNRFADLFGLEKLERHRRSLADFGFEAAIAEPHPRWSGAVGFVTSLLRPELVHASNVDVYLCGPPPMIDAAIGWLDPQGVADRDIHTEKFVASR